MVSSLLKLQSTHLSTANTSIYWSAKLGAFYIYSYIFGIKLVGALKSLTDLDT
jgi:hypothetical protein